MLQGRQPESIINNLNALLQCRPVALLRMCLPDAKRNGDSPYRAHFFCFHLRWSLTDVRPECFPVL